MFEIFLKKNPDFFLKNISLKKVFETLVRYKKSRTFTNGKNMK